MPLRSRELSLPPTSFELAPDGNQALINCTRYVAYAKCDPLFAISMSHFGECRAPVLDTCGFAGAEGAWRRIMRGVAGKIMLSKNGVLPG